MLLIKSSDDLRRYLEARHQMAARQGAGQHTNGMMFAFEEAIKAVDALMAYQRVNHALESHPPDSVPQ